MLSDSQGRTYICTIFAIKPCSYALRLRLAVIRLAVIRLAVTPGLPSRRVIFFLALNVLIRILLLNEYHLIEKPRET